MSAPQTLQGSRRLDAGRRRHVHALAWLPPLGAVAAALLAFQTGGVSAPAIASLVVLYVLSALGITVGYHRLFTHRAFEAGTGVRVALAVCGGLAGQGPLIYWVALHRLHHERSDEPEDPHSPHVSDAGPHAGWRGFWHAHMGWLWTHPLPNTARHAKDLIRDPVIAAVNHLYPLWLLLGLLAPALVVGAITRSPLGALEGLLWGGLLRLFLIQHVIWSINSVCHLWGDRPHATGDRSTNNAWLALPSFGESWHNNHHHAQSSAFHGLSPRQLDLAGLFIRLLGALGHAWKIRGPRS